MSKSPDTGPATDFHDDNPAVTETEKCDDEKDAIELTKELLALFERTRFMAPELWRPRAAELVSGIAEKIGLVDQRPDPVDEAKPVVNNVVVRNEGSIFWTACVIVVGIITLAFLWRAP